MVHAAFLFGEIFSWLLCSRDPSCSTSWWFLVLEAQHWDGLGTQCQEIRGLCHGKLALGDLPPEPAVAEGPKDMKR